jgi:uncharacterized protein (TIGR03083 family)
VTTNSDLMPIVAAERRAFSGVLEGLSDADWNVSSLCSGWRVREVLAHISSTAANWPVMLIDFRTSAPSATTS